MNTLIKLFTYGTLQQTDVQEELFGRRLVGTAETLVGYALQVIKIEEEFGIIEYDILVETGNSEDTVNGIVYSITATELNQADLYEGIHYNRVEVHLQSNEKVWAYSATK